jgi:hypothetical protein
VPARQSAPAFTGLTFDAPSGDLLAQPLVAHRQTRGATGRSARMTGSPGAEPPIEARVKDLLDETRLAMLGTQILLGLQYRAAFSAAFSRLPPPLHWLGAVALLLILVATALLLGTPSFHHIAEHGHATGRMVRHASATLKMALLPLSCALGIDVTIGLHSTLGAIGATVMGGSFVAGTILAWYIIPFVAASRRFGLEADMEDKQQSLETRIEQGLTELRVVLPGAQALFGFQFTAVLTQSYAQLPIASKAVHVASLALVATAIVMLIAPAAYHRIAAAGRAEPGVLRYIVRMIVPAEGLLVLGLLGDAYVTVHMISGSRLLAISLSLLGLVGFAGVLYGVPLAARRRRVRAASATVTA